MENLNLGVWNDFTNRIKHKLETSEISNFMTWDILINTMIAGVDPIEIEHLNKNWDYWADKITENKLKPNSHETYPISSTNNLHHAYSLQIMMDNFGIKLSDFNTVTEFGGGYGNTARLFRKASFNGTYYIYDIPELCRIQNYYLSQNSINDINLLMKNDSIENVPKESLFLGLWSITESPISTRNYYLNNLKFFSHDYIFIAMGDMFYTENNMDWLQNTIIPELEQNNFTHKLIKIQHGNGMYYFVAKKKYK